jgi:hypothetical protein
LFAQHVFALFADGEWSEHTAVTSARPGSTTVAVSGSSKYGSGTSRAADSLRRKRRTIIVALQFPADDFSEAIACVPEETELIL